MLSNTMLALFCVSVLGVIVGVFNVARHDTHGNASSASQEPGQDIDEVNKLGKDYAPVEKDEFYSQWMNVRFIVQESHAYAVVRYAIVDEDGGTIRRRTANIDASAMQVDLRDWVIRSIDCAVE